MGAQLSLKAALPLAGILLTASDRCNKTGPCAIIQIKYVLPKLCYLPQYSYGSRDPTTGYSAAPRTRVVGPGIRTHTGAGDTVWQPLFNLYTMSFIFFVGVTD